MNKKNWLELTTNPLSPAAAIDFVSDPTAGAIDIFLGTTRAELDPTGRQLLALDYEAYTEMAQQQFTTLADTAASRWPICKLAILHRLGRVPIAHPSVIIAVSTPHRADSFQACQWLIDTLKKEITIWKKEIWTDGSASWVGV
jgi:molybdopterin synthase catalytic subunit